MDLLADVRTRHNRLVKLVEGITDAEARADSALPGWSRGHVLSHLAYVGHAFARQVDYAMDGRLIEVYDGGRPARDAAIEAGAGRPAGELRHAVVESVDVFERAVARLGPDDLDRPVVYRGGVVRDVLNSHWREVEIHATDLRLGYTSSEWTSEFCAHLIDYLLEPRTPEGVRLVLVDHEREWAAGSGTSVAVRGALTDLAPWLAGREPVGALDGDVPVLDPWP